MSTGEFECGHYCDTGLLEAVVTAATSVLILGYVTYLVKTKSKQRTFQMIRLYMAIFAVAQIITVLLPGGLIYTLLFTTPRQVALFFGLFEWLKSVVDTTYHAVKLSSEPPKWIRWYTRVQQATCFLFLVITYALGASQSGNPRCSTLQALNNSYRVVAGLVTFTALLICLVAVHRQVTGLTNRVHSPDSDDRAANKRVAIFRQALKKIRRITIGIGAAIVFLVATFVNTMFAQGEPIQTCGDATSAVLAPLTGLLAAVLILWSTSIERNNRSNSSYSGPSSTTASTNTNTFTTSHKRSGTRTPPRRPSGGVRSSLTGADSEVRFPQQSRGSATMSNTEVRFPPQSRGSATMSNTRPESTLA